MTIRVAVSACLAGRQVRWDGSDRRDNHVLDVIGAMAELVEVCPEVELGLGVPRERIRLVDAPGGVRLIGEDSGRDLTEAMASWAAGRLGRADLGDVDGWVLKSSSPSCGLSNVRLYRDASAAAEHRRDGVGRFAAAIRARWPTLPVVGEDELTDDTALARFVSALRAHHRARRGRS